MKPKPRISPAMAEASHRFWMQLVNDGAWNESIVITVADRDFRRLFFPVEPPSYLRQNSYIPPASGKRSLECDIPAEVRVGDLIFRSDRY